MTSLVCKMKIWILRNVDMIYAFSIFFSSFNYSFADKTRLYVDLIKNTRITTLYIKNIKFFKKSISNILYFVFFPSENLLNLVYKNGYLQYFFTKRGYLFYVTLAILFAAVGVSDVFPYSNSALSLMVYLIFIILILLLILYTPSAVANKLNDIESYLITFSSLKNKSVIVVSNLLSVSSELKLNLNLVFFVIWKLFFSHGFVHNFIKSFDEFEGFSWDDTNFNLNVFSYGQVALYKF